MVGTFTMLGYIAILLLIALYYKKLNIIKEIILSIFAYFSEYVIISGLFFIIDYFDILRTLICILSINCILIIYVFKKNKKIEINYDIKRYIIPILIVCCILPITVNKFELHGMGQDEGVYQIKAIALMTGNTEKQLDFKEYNNLIDNEQKNQYKDMVKSKFVGLDNYDVNKPTLSLDSEMSDVSGIFHGVPTFPALLALWGKIFGITNMQGIQTIFLIIGIFFIWFIGENLQLKRSGKVLATAIFAISPVVLWVSKSSLSEMFLANIVCAIIYFWTDVKDKNSNYFSAISIITFSFYHVTIYTIMPLIVISFAIRYILNKEKSDIYAAIISIIGFIAGYTMMIYTSPTYTTNNTRIPIEKIFPGITDNIVLTMVYLASVIAIIFILAIYWVSVRESCKFRKIEITHKSLHYSIIILFVLMIAKMILSAISYAKENESIIIAIKNSNIMGYIWGSGIFLMPIIIILIFKNKYSILHEKNNCTILILFIYCIMIYSAFLRTNIPHYYYYSRYIVPFIPIITLLAAQLINNISYKIKYLICLLVTFIYLPFNYTLAIGLDDTRMNWNILKEVVSNIEKDDIVIIEDGSSEVTKIVQTLALPIKYITGSEIYPVFKENENKIDNFINENNQLVYITDKKIQDDSIYELKYKNRVYVSDDYQQFHNKLIPYPINFSKNEYDIYLYRTKYRKIYNMKNDYTDIKSDGLGPLENDFAWSLNKNVNIWCDLLKKNYKLKIKLGPGMLIDNNLSLIVNENYIETIEVKKGQSNVELEYTIPKHVLNNGENIITICSELWTPSDFGINDNRQLGFSLVEFKFED